MKFQEEFKVGQLLAEELDQIRINLYELQEKRISNLTERIAPIIVRGEPSRATTYKLQLKYLQYEIHPLSQRLRLTQMRVEHEEMRTRQIVDDTRRLRDQITDLTNKIVVITKGLPMNKITLQELPAKGKWKMLFSGFKASSVLGHFPEFKVLSPSPDLKTPEPDLLL